MANFTDKNAGDVVAAADVNALSDDTIDSSTGHQHSGGSDGHATLKPDAVGDGASITWDGRVLFDKGGDLASGSAITPGTDGNYFDITGTTTITSIATLQAGTIVIFQFDGALTLTHNATTLILQGATNLTTSAGDIVAFISEGSGNWREVWRRLAVLGGVANNARISTGSYTGDGATSQAITGVGFQVLYVHITKRQTADGTGYDGREIAYTSNVILDDIAAGGMVSLVGTGGGRTFEESGIIALGADGFTVDDDGSDADPNANTVVYNYLVLG